MTSIGVQRGARKSGPRLVVAALALAASALLVAAQADSPAPAPPGRGGVRVALLPMVNLAGLSAPVTQVSAWLREQLLSRGVALVGEEELESIMTKGRMRDFSGVSREMARAFHESGVGVALLVSLGHFDENDAPKLALSARLVSTDDPPRILWMDSVALVGDDDPGVLSLGVVHNIEVLVERSVAGIAEKVGSQLDAGLANARPGRTVAKGERRFRPTSAFRADFPRPAAGDRLRIAVLPFANQTGRAHAGELIALRLIEGLIAAPGVEIIEPGIVRQALLQGRVIQQGGASMAQAELIKGLIEADLVVTGRVLDYHDYVGVDGVPVVEFSVYVVDPSARKVVWVSLSRGRGDAGVFFFDWRRVRSAHRVADGMVAAIVGRMFEGPGKL